MFGIVATDPGAISPLATKSAMNASIPKGISQLIQLRPFHLSMIFKKEKIEFIEKEMMWWIG